MLKRMVVGSLRIQLQLDGVNSLKEKRMILRSLIDRLRREERFSVAEVDDHDLWGNATIGVACVGNDVPSVEAALLHAETLFEMSGTVVVSNVEREIDRW